MAHSCACGAARPSWLIGFGQSDLRFRKQGTILHTRNHYEKGGNQVPGEGGEKGR